MKKSFSLLLTFFAFVTFTIAQVRTPAPSPSSKVTQMVGLTEVTIEYSRPSVKGRTIFGDLVPYGSLWRTGANAATKISFDKDVQVGGQDLKAGSYALITKPGKAEWAVMLFEHTSGNWGTYTKDDVKAAATVMVKPMDIGVNVESMLIDVNNITANSATIDLVWASTAVAIPLTVHTDKEVMASIDKVMAGPSQGDYYNAATYMRNAGKDLNVALEYMNKGISADNPRFWQLRQKSLLLADMGPKS